MTGSGVSQVRMTDHFDQELITGEAVALDVRPAGFILRAAGAIIDWVAYIVLLVLLGWLVLSFGSNLNLDQALGKALLTLLLVFCLVIVPTVVEAATQGRSLGKLVIGARIVRDDGGAIGLRHAFIRALTAILEVFMTFGGLAALVALLNGKSKRIGDYLAGTYSQHERVAVVESAVYPVPERLRDWAMIADVGRLPDRLSRRISAFLKQASELTPGTRTQLAAQLSDETSAYVSPLPRVDPEVFLSAVAVLRRERDYTALMLERERLMRLEPALTGMPHSFPVRGSDKR